MYNQKTVIMNILSYSGYAYFKTGKKYRCELFPKPFTTKKQMFTAIDTYMGK